MAKIRARGFRQNVAALKGKLAAAKGRKKTKVGGLRWYGAQMSVTYRDMMFAGVQGGARYLTEAIKRRFDTPKSGRKYVKPSGGKQPSPGSGKGRRGYYTASAKGESPAIPTGKLRASVTYKLNAPKALATEALIGVIGAKAAEKHDDKKGATTTGNVALILELGLGKLSGPHPFIRPALDANRAVLKGIILNGMKGGAIVRKTGDAAAGFARTYARSWT